MERLLTLNIDGPYLANSEQNDQLKFEGLLSKELGVNRSNLLPVLVRGMELSPYWTATDERIVECSIKSVVHEEQSEYQKIQILDTIDFGRTLLLDGQVNLAESDLIYTLTLLHDEEYGGAEVLILGGGDGALLSQLLCTTPSPAHVTMVELDQAVMTAVARHMPAVLWRALPHLSGRFREDWIGE